MPMSRFDQPVPENAIGLRLCKVVGETGDFWADFLIDDNGTWDETVALDRDAWNSLKNHWMRSKIASA